MSPAYAARLRQAAAWLLFLALTGWGTLAIICSNFQAGPRYAAAAVFIAAALCGVSFPAGGAAKTAWFSAAFTAVLGWWLLLPPSNDRDWEPDVAALPSAVISGSRVTIRNIRNCDYRTETDYTVKHYDRTFDLGALRSMDLFLVDWGLRHVAHAMLSFGFAGGEHVCFSIETRKKKGEKYSSVRGFFKQYELTYVVADERDAVRLRTNYRKGENVYLYRLDATPELMRQVFTSYLASVNSLKSNPRWYNALTSNCTTDSWKHIVPYYTRKQFDWRILASGHIPEMAYEFGVLDKQLPLRELRRRSLINERSKAAGSGPEYSKLIRRGLPGFDGQVYSAGRF
ncbi:MAG TPA: DUF4105 domain-containing protein [Elusimicrobiales bacterium]|nr:DUF4105 domain-containing protein [Elusimicrobiales bacterium]